MYMCHQPYGLLVANYTPHPRHAPTRANQPPYKTRTHAQHYHPPTTTTHTHAHFHPVSKAAAIFRKYYDWCAHDQGQITAIPRGGRPPIREPSLNPISRGANPEGERGPANHSRSQEPKRLEIEINQSESWN